MPTEGFSDRFRDVELWPTADAVAAMAEAQLAAAAAVQSQAAAIAAAADEAAERLRDPAGRLVYAGAGTSGRLAVLDGVELGPTYGWDRARLAFLLAGGEAALLSSVEGAEDDSAAAATALAALAPTGSDVVVAVAASGRTPWTVAIASAAAAAGALSIGIASNAATPLLAAAAHPILLDTGEEAVAGSTRMKAGTAQKIALSLLSTAMMLRLGRISHGLMIDMRLSNRKLRARAAAMVARLAGTDPAAAGKALEAAGDDIRLAVLIALGASVEHARQALEAAAGDLRQAMARLG